MPGHAPYLMPDGQPLSKYLTLEKEDHAEKKRARRRHSSLRGKDEIWAHLKRQQVTPTHLIAEVFTHCSYRQMPSKKEINTAMTNLEPSQKWEADDGLDGLTTSHPLSLKIIATVNQFVSCRMLRDMTGPMTMDQIESQFCPPPWGEMPKKEDPFHVLFDHHRSLWELLRRIDLGTEQTLLESMRQKRFESKERRSSGARAALKAWQRISRDHRNFLKKVNATVILEAEMPLLAFKLHKQTSLQNEVRQSILMICLLHVPSLDVVFGIAKSVSMYAGDL